MTSVKWYPYLKQNTDKPYKALLEHVTPDPKNLIICRQLEYRNFALFNTYVEFGKYSTLEVAPIQRCFYEVIFGDHPQKIYFDIDMNENLDYGDHLRDQLIEKLILKFPFIKITDIFDFTSHSETKRSYHIVVDNWCVLNHEENRYICEQVRSELDTKYQKYVDEAVYSSLQQFRILGSRKWKSDRVKIINSKSTWKYPLTPLDDKHKYILELGGSLITNVNSCKLIEPLKPQVPKAVYAPSDCLDATTANECLDVCARFAGLDTANTPSFPYKIASINGSLITLKRLRPSKCRLCSRIHENENPYLFVVGENRNVYFNCRRSQGKSLYLGSLGVNFIKNPETIKYELPISLETNASPPEPSQLTLQEKIECGFTIAYKKAQPENKKPDLSSFSIY